MKRREFITLVGVGTATPLIISACTPKASQPVSNAVRSDGFQEVGTLTELGKNQQILRENLGNSQQKALIIPNPTDNNQLIAVNPTCTHAGCTVTWESEKQVFICPCHDSQFSSDGKVIEGPATEPLASYEAKSEGDAILVKIS
ncbi:ubiquinol-cytochrome c reductase iron-sulfur subunit [Cyanothece sp. BG0011]|uniref:QcrA and Rieske domain-containing protein n=1 Tax=Cyanothece sp. BG0011 TaxID=2082950 RepID=UPI000D1DEF77|nr:ubiquinol-cytochrome c reductase iron-sulfur subunit [Cyanothece sp. BG0011]